MHINFRAQPDPLGSSRGSIKSGPSEDKTSHFAYRNNPQARTVGHLKGLNDVPVCVLRDPSCISGHFIMPKIEQSQSIVRTRTSVGRTFPGSTTTTTPNLQPLKSKRNSLPQPISHDKKEDLALRSNRTRSTTVIKTKSDLQRKYIPEQSQNMPILETRSFPPTLALRHRPEVMEDMNYTLTYLDHEIKILEKLRDILQTDSLTEIREWLTKASLNEKELISNFIRSDITTRDLLNYQQKHGQSGSEIAHLDLQALLKSQKAIGSTGEEKQRKTGQGSRGSTESKSDKGKDNLFTKGEKITIPVCDLLPLENSPSTSTIQERRLSPSGTQDSSHLIYKKSRFRLTQHITEENDPKKL